MKIAKKRTVYLRKAYLNNQCTHEQYYSQFVTGFVKQYIQNIFGTQVLLDAYQADKNFNTIPLPKWELLARMFSFTYAMKEVGDYETLAGKVCVLKEVARQIAVEAEGEK